MGWDYVNYLLYYINYFYQLHECEYRPGGGEGKKYNKAGKRTNDM